jgi:hypothetical protein
MTSATTGIWSVPGSALFGYADRFHHSPGRIMLMTLLMGLGGRDGYDCEH